MKQDRKVVLFIAMSLDGYIAAKDESLDWLFKVDGVGDNGFSDFYETIDTLIMGKRTYDWLIDQRLTKFPYQDKTCYVLTRSVTPKRTEDVMFVQENVSDFINDLRKQSGMNIWLVGGGDLLYSFIQENLIDEMMITIAPTIIGNGIPLFKKSNNQVNLTLIDTKQYNQFITLHYKVNN